MPSMTDRFTQGNAIRYLASELPVAGLIEQIDAHPEIWDTHTMRTEAYATPHGKVSDIWVRYNDWSHFHGDQAAFNEEHDSVWYPVVGVIPASVALAKMVMALVGGDRLGGVLITRIPPGGRVEPHIDTGWHAGYYAKYAVQMKGNADQAFQFDGEKLSSEPGDLYAFDNSKTHWVTNDSDTDRMTFIVCIRGQHQE